MEGVTRADRRALLCAEFIAVVSNPSQQKDNKKYVLSPEDISMANAQLKAR